jgi:hypothetical protein
VNSRPEFLCFLTSSNNRVLRNIDKGDAKKQILFLLRPIGSGLGSSSAVAVLVFFLGGIITESANETTLAELLCATGDDLFHCVGSNLLSTKGDSFLFVLTLVSFVKGDSTNWLLLLGCTAASTSSSSSCLSSIELPITFIS